MIWILNRGIFRVCADVFEVIAWIIDPLMKNAGKYFTEALFDKLNLFERDITFVQLIVADNAIHQTMNQPLNLRHRRDPQAFGMPPQRKRPS